MTDPGADSASSGSSSIWRRIRRDVILLGSGNVTVVFAQLGFRSILIAALAPAGYGRLSLILAIYNTVWIVGASGVPNSVARYLAIAGPADDSAIIRSALRASTGPIVAASLAMAIVSGLLLKSPLASIFAAVGVASLVYSLLAMGVLRGRGKTAAASAVLPIAALGELAPLATLWFSGARVTPLSAFAIFCAGNLVGALAGLALTLRSSRRSEELGEAQAHAPSDSVPTPRQLLRFSVWLALATGGVAILPLVIRASATFDSYTLVAFIDVALVLFSIPQRLGTVIVLAVTPHASRAFSRGDTILSISRREHVLVVVPFVFAAAIVAFTPIVTWLFEALGKPEYKQSAEYLALVLLAGPARILYGVVEGVLIAHGEGRYLALTALVAAGGASLVIVAAAALGSTIVAFAVFVAAFWLIYLVGLARLRRLTRLALPAAG
jgi:O-antigen/teichoic acid export membrane protein